MSVFTTTEREHKANTRGQRLQSKFRLNRFSCYHLRAVKANLPKANCVPYGLNFGFARITRSASSNTNAGGSPGYAFGRVVMYDQNT